MTKITISICKVYRNTGRTHFHRKKTKPAWKHFFLSDEDSDGLKFGTEWVNSVTAQLLKLKKWHKRYFVCVECSTVFSAYIKNNRMEAICPYCTEDE